jgi:hypothetical protein
VIILGNILPTIKGRFNNLGVWESTEPYLSTLGKISGASRMIKQSPEKSTTLI